MPINKKLIILHGSMRNSIIKRGYKKIGLSSNLKNDQNIYINIDGKKSIFIL